MNNWNIFTEEHLHVWGQVHFLELNDVKGFINN